MKAAEIGFSLFLCSIALLFFIVGLSYPYNTDLGPGPGFVPVWISGIMVILTFILTIISIKNHTKGNFITSKKGLINFLIYIMLLILTVILTKLIGLVISLALFCLAVFKVVDRYNWKDSVLVSVGVAIIIFVIFDYWLQIPLPKSILFN